MRSYTFKEKLAAAAVLVFVACVLWIMENQYSIMGWNKNHKTIAQSLESEHAILLRLGGEEDVLMEKGSEETIYPASLTKMMTVLVAIEETENVDDLVTLSEKLFLELEGTDASMAGFLPNEETTLMDLIYGAMLPSGAEASVGLAVHISGSEAAFVERMNDKAIDLGLAHTSFTNVTGLHDPNHYTTSEDMALLLEYALANNQFRDVFTAKSYTTKPTAYHPDGITFMSSFFLGAPHTEVKKGELLGGKTGYTKEAGLCLASLAEVNGAEYILVTAEAEGTHHTRPFHIEDAINVYEGISYQ